MHDFSQDWLKADGLKAHLQREMAPVKAPESLWPRIQAERRARRAAPRTGWILWPAVATVMLLASGDLVWQSVNAASGRTPLTAGMTAGLVSKSVRAKAPQSLVMAVSCRTCHVESGLY